MKAHEDLLQRHIRPLTPIPTGVTPDLSKMQPFSAMIFDVYGTLLISGAGDIGMGRRPIERFDELHGLLKRFGIDRTPQSLLGALDLAIENAHHIRQQQGIDYPEIDIVRVWQRVLGIHDLTRVKAFALEYELIVNPVYLMPGAAELLLASNIQNLPTGIISNAQFSTVYLLEWFLGGTLEQCGFDPRLLFFSWREEHAKPSTVMFSRAKAVLLGMGVPVRSVLYVGNDMQNDILPAKSVGFNTALFAGDRRSLRQRETNCCCRDLQPDLIVTDLRQLIAATGNP